MRLLKISLLILCLLKLNLAVHAKGDDDMPEGIRITGKAGASVMIGEIARNFSLAVSEFSNQPGLYSALELSGFVTPALEIGGGFSISSLQGIAEDPAFSAIGHHASMMEPFPEPVEYSNTLYGSVIFAQYHFDLMPQNPHTLSLFAKAGAGLIFNESELFLSNRTGDEILFGKGITQDKTNMLINGVYILGSGLSYALTQSINLNFTANLNVVGYDFLDVVHNHDATGNRLEMLGYYTDLALGIGFRLGGGDGKPKKKSGGNLPFAP